MQESNKINERNHVTHVALVLGVLIFSLVLIVEDVLLGRDSWMIPVMVSMSIVSVVLHVGRILEKNLRTYIYAAFLLLETFYYSTNAQNLYDITPLIILMLILLALCGSVGLLYICLGTGLVAICYHFISAWNTVDLDSSVVVRTIFHLLLIVFAAVVVLRLLKTQLKLQEHYAEQLKVVKEENERAGNFLVNVSHEIRTPINAVIGLSSILMDQKLDPQVMNEISLIKDGGYRVAEQIGDILDYTEIDMNKLTVSSENYMIASIVNDVVTLSMSNKPDSVELIFDIDTHIPQILRGDGAKIKKILWHLISNGIKFTRHGGVYVRVWSIEHEYGINLCMEIQDTGIGMTQEEQERIFDRFYQSDSGRTRAAGGLGLGLSIVHGFVTSMGGFLTIDSAPDDGTTVRVSIPQKVEDPTYCMNVENSSKLCLIGYYEFKQFNVPMVREFYYRMIKNLTKGLSVVMHMASSEQEADELIKKYNATHLLIGIDEYRSNPDYFESVCDRLDVIVVADKDFTPKTGSRVRLLPKPFYCFPMASILNAAATKSKAVDANARLYCPGVRALVVDDEPMNLLVAEGIFKSYGIKVTTALSGQESINKCTEQEFDIVFMDHMMPEMDGIEAMHRIKAEVSRLGRDLPIVALTANAVSSAKEMFISAGFDGFVSKPIDLSELDRVLKHVLPKSKLTTRPVEEEAVNESRKAHAPAAAPAPVEPAKPAPKKKDVIAELNAIGVDTASGLKYFQNDYAFYNTLLEQYVTDSAKKSGEMNDFFAKQNWKEYAIRVHGLKSTSKMIGAEKVSLSAKALEAAAKTGDGETIVRDHDDMMKQYRNLVETIADCMNIDIPEWKTVQALTAPSASADVPLEFAPAADEPMEFAPVEDAPIEFMPVEEVPLEFEPVTQDTADNNGKGGDLS